MIKFKSWISRRITTHRRRHGRMLALRAALQARKGGWLAIVCLRIKLFTARWLEGRARRRLVDVTPRNGAEAQEKFQYMMALLIADGSDFQSADIEKVISTLRTFRPDICAQLSGLGESGRLALSDGSP